VKNSIPVSKEHGVNPSVQVCFYCKKSIGIILFGKLHETKMKEMFGKEFAERHLKHEDPRDTAAPREVVLDLEPCEDCAVFYPHAKEGVFLVECDEREVVGKDQYGRRVAEKVPVPTGNFVVMTDEAIRRIFTGDVVDQVLEKRVAMVDLATWKLLGLHDAPERLIKAPEPSPE
jgi:hypothetical protein